MSFTEKKIIKKNIEAILKAPNQCFTESDFILLDMNNFSHPKELILRMEELDIIELDLDDEKYYLTEKGYAYLSPKIKKRKIENKPIALTRRFYRDPQIIKFNIQLLYLAIIVGIITLIYNVIKNNI